MRKLLFVLLLLSGCQNVNRAQLYGENLSHWIGWPETQLYAIWGRPTQIFYVDMSEKVVSYVRTSQNGENIYGNVGNQGFSLSRWISGWFEPPVMRQQPPIYYCKTSFVIKNGVVVQYNFNGDYCGGE